MQVVICNNRTSLSINCAKGELTTSEAVFEFDNDYSENYWKSIN